MTTNAIIARRARLAAIGKTDRQIAAVIIQTAQKTAEDRKILTRPSSLRSDSIAFVGCHR